MKTYNIRVWDNQLGEFTGTETLRIVPPVTIGWSVDSRSGCVIATNLDTGVKAVYCHGFFHRVTGTNPDAIAGRFEAETSVLYELGLVREGV